jgi:hypothetical protein
MGKDDLVQAITDQQHESETSQRGSARLSSDHGG